MDVANTHHTIKKIKYALVFFYALLAIGCVPEDTVTIEQVDYEAQRAVGVSFRTALDVEDVRVFVGEESRTSVIGVIVSDQDLHSFTPVVPFTPGQTYTLRQRDTLVLARFSIPEREDLKPAEVIGIYPQVDTVPENLLKVHLEFAQPMQRLGNALDHIRVTNLTDGEEVQPFLRLESELWNAEGTLLTLWLDPGRIKTDLIPNREQGLPIRRGKTYRVSLDPRWKSEEGAPLKEAYSRQWTVGPRDDKRPELREWSWKVRQEAGLRPVEIDFGESMDAFLARETLRFFDDAGWVRGTYTLEEAQQKLRFLPARTWQGGEITVRVAARLEDLAGNNLQRLFDRPVGNGEEGVRDTTEVHTIRIQLAD